MSISLGNLFGAAANATTAFGKAKSLKSFLHHIDDFGIQVTNNFEVNVAGLEDLTFFVQDVTFGGITQKFETLHYDGRSIPIPSYIDYEHSGSLKVINDAHGYIYSAVSNFLFGKSRKLLDNGVVMTIKCLTGDKDYKGSVITLKSVNFEKVNGLSFQYEGGSVSTFDLNFQYIDFTFTPGSLKKAGGVAGAASSLLS